MKFDAMSWPAAAYQKYAAACVPHRTSFTDGRHAELDLDLFISFSLAEVEYNPDGETSATHFSHSMLEVRAVHGSFIGCKQNQIALRGCHLDDLSTVHPLYEEFATMKVLPSFAQHQHRLVRKEKQAVRILGERRCSGGPRSRLQQAALLAVSDVQLL